MRAMFVRSKLIQAARVILAAFLLIQASFAMSCVTAAPVAFQMSQSTGDSPCDGDSPVSGHAGCATQCFTAVSSAENTVALDMRTASPMAIAPSADLGIRALLPRYTAPLPMAGAPPPSLPSRILLHSFLI